MMERDREFHRRLLAEALSERFGLALIDGDAAAAERVAREGVDEGLTHAQVDEAVIAPALHRVGLLWERGEIGVAHEHMATQITLRVMAMLRELFRVARERAEDRVMLAAVEGEQHVVGLQMASELLEEAGYDSVLLGPDVPTGALADVVDEHKPQIVALTATMSSSLAKVPPVLAAVKDASPATGVIVGGRFGRGRLPEAHEVTFTTTVIDVVELADALVRRPGLN
jgi:methanogenic corrinoid protein MtbC1